MVGYAGRLRYFSERWRKITSDKYILKIISGYEIPFSETPRQFHPPEQNKWSNNEFKILESEVKKLLEKNAIEKCNSSKNQFLSSFFLIPKPDGTKKFILNLKNLNKFIDPSHFKIEDLRSARNLLFPKAFMASLNVKDAYFLIPVHENSRKYLRFSFKEQSIYLLTFWFEYKSIYFY